MKEIKVSVIIPAYNAVQTISRCLDSLEAQTQRELIEIIVVDSSNDHTEVLVKQKFPEVKLYHFNQQKYAGDARNYGVAQSQGNIIAFLDADCWVEPTWVSQIIEVHQQNEHPVVGGGNRQRKSRQLCWLGLLFLRLEPVDATTPLIRAHRYSHRMPFVQAMVF